MKQGVVVAAVFAALSAAASIVTVRNGIFTYPPSYATFRGTDSEPGIAPPWIPYGTYTRGAGSNEYARISAKLMGVVASAFDGLDERERMPLEFFAGEADYTIRQTMLPDYTNAPYSDGGEFLRGITNSSARILDAINADSFLTVYRTTVIGETRYFYNNERTGQIEELLAHEESGDGISWHGGIARMYAGSALNEMCAAAQLATDPPISGGWTNRLPFIESDSNLWVNVYPIYAALGNDAHVFAATNATPTFYRPHFDYAPNMSCPRFFSPAHLADVWGGDVLGTEQTGTGRALSKALASMPMSYTVEDVLSYNTAMSAADYSHWHNMTARLDWKRLGIICQLESQMDRTYLVRDNEDRIPQTQREAHMTRQYAMSMTVEIPTSGGAPQFETTFHAPATGWAKTSETTEATTNAVDWSFPTAQFHGAYIEGGIVDTHGEEGTYVQTSESDIVAIAKRVADDMMTLGVSDDGWLVVVLSGEVTAPNNAGLQWSWEALVRSIPDGGGEAYYFPTNSATEMFAPEFYPTNVALNLGMIVDKYATTRYTEADESAFPAFSTLMPPYPQQEIWETNYVRRQSRPTLDVMLDVRGFRYWDNITNFAQLTWQKIVGGDSTRQFMMDQQRDLWAHTSEESFRSRFEITKALNNSVRARFYGIAGMSVDSNGFAAINARDEAEIRGQLATFPLKLQLSLSPLRPSVLYPPVATFGVSFSVVDGQIADSFISEAFWYWWDGLGVDHTGSIDKVGNNYLLGSYGFEVDGAGVDRHLTTNEPIRVDAHQDQMIITDWLPRNLRSPTTPNQP